MNIKKASRASIVLLATLLAAAFIIGFDILLGPGGAMYYIGLLGGVDTTIFSSGYSESKFLQVRPGMQKADVINLLGPPLAVSTRECDRTHWSLFFSGKNWVPLDQLDSTRHTVYANCRQSEMPGHQVAMVLHYTMSLTDKDYLVRTVGLSDAGLVLFVGSSYWTD